MILMTSRDHHPLGGKGNRMSRLTTAALRKARAVELALGGNSYDKIAAEVGYANRGTAWRTVHNALRERTDDAVDLYRSQEIERLDRLQRAVWADAMAGDVRATNAVLRIIDQRVRLLGLDRVETAPRESYSLVIPSSEATQ